MQWPAGIISLYAYVYYRLYSAISYQGDLVDLQLRGPPMKDRNAPYIPTYVIVSTKEY